ncbi:MAG: PEGA domain-containing protein [Deltaproteobacteria bacterium]|nr:PEGA domain-containing protein [Deltaproteobacteria bacterium]
MISPLMVAAALATAEPAPTLVLPPVSLADAAGRLPEPGIVEQARAALAAAAAGHVRLLVEPALVAPPPPPLPADLASLAARAREAAETLDTKQGVRLHRELIAAAEHRLVEVGDVSVLFDVRLSLASLYAALREQALAQAELDAAARLRPNASLDLGRWPPALVEAFAQARVRVAAEPGAELDVRAEPAGATLWVDGLRVGEAPLATTVRRGPHLLVLAAAGYRPRIFTLDAVAGARARVDERLAEIPAAALGARLRAELGGEGRRAEALGLAAALAAEVSATEDKVARVVACGVVAVPGGVVVLLAPAIDEPRLALVALDPVLTGAPAALGAALASFDKPAGAFSGGIERSAGPGAPDAASLRLDLERRLLGLGRGAPPVAVGAPAPAAPTPPGTVEPPAPGGFPWLWVGAGAGIAVLAAAGAGAAFVLLQPAPEQIQDPDRLRVALEVAP